MTDIFADCILHLTAQPSLPNPSQAKYRTVLLLFGMAWHGVAWRACHNDNDNDNDNDSDALE